MSQRGANTRALPSALSVEQLGVTALAIIGSVALSGCSALNSGPTTTTTVTVAKNSNSAPAASGAEDTAEKRTPEDFPRAIAGRNTSAAFAENVRQQFVQQWVADGNTNTTVVTTSPRHRRHLQHDLLR